MMDVRHIMHDCFNRDKNKIKINRTNTIHHEVAKAVVSIILRMANRDIYTEAIFKNKSRADILDVDEMTAIEILNTETPEMLKTKDYPVYIYPIKVDKEIKEKINEVVDLLTKKLWKL